ncbi:hypothetical protein [Streptomyces sp900116325]|uniref:Uncharacterized protein n=1 Tax=Streptomyces sp. 900116325 TaxID=3154295 RepID=A0ABV2UGH5_9ACTN
MRPGPAIRAICRAIGIVVTLAGLRAEDGRDVREISQHTDIKMRHVTELIV